MCKATSNDTTANFGLFSFEKDLEDAFDANTDTDHRNLLATEGLDQLVIAAASTDRADFILIE